MDDYTDYPENISTRDHGFLSKNEPRKEKRFTLL